MFHYPHTVVALIPRTGKNLASVEMEGLCSGDFIKARIPCSFDMKRRWVGPREKRVEVEGDLTVMATSTTKRYFVVGTFLIFKHAPEKIFQIESVEDNDGVFLGDGTLDITLIRFGVSVPPTGDLRKYLDAFGV